MTRMTLIEADTAPTAPPWSVTEWIGSEPLTVEGLVGRVVVLHTFQMLCPGCVQHGLPQAQRIRAAFDPVDVAVVGLHTVFEHHEAMGPQALRAFVHEYRIDFPVGIDTPGRTGPIPVTMGRYALVGTPSLVLIDRTGKLRMHAFGRPTDLQVGAAIAQLVVESSAATVLPSRSPERERSGCTTDGCRCE